MDYVGDFNSTVESIFVKPVQAMGDSIIHDVNTVLYSNNLTEKVMASSSLLLDAAMVFGVPESLAMGVSSKISGAFSKFSFWKSAEAIESFGNFVANNHINALRLQQQLTGKEIATMFNMSGELTRAAIDNSRRIPLKINNPELTSILSERGNFADWGKYETTAIHTDAGFARTHFYHNPVADEVYYDRDYKAIFDHQGKWNVDLPRNFKMPGNY